MYCPNCYRKNEDTNKFCSNCGHNLCESTKNIDDQKEESIYCTHCGRSIKKSEATKFCPECGFSLNSGEAQATKLVDRIVVERGKFCTHCGSSVRDEAVICLNCGCSVGGNKQVSTTFIEQDEDEDEESAGLCLLGFLFPIIGLILFCVMYNKTPNKAKAIGEWSLFGFILELLLSGCMAIF